MTRHSRMVLSRLRQLAPAQAALVVALAAWGCSSEQSLTNPPLPDSGDALVSEPVPFGQAAVSVGGPAGSFATPTGAVEFSFTALLPETYPNGETVEIRNQRTGERISAPMLEGGLDPIGIPAAVDDELAITILQGQSVLAALRWIVPVRRPPIVVRTDPPKRKTKVPLNASVMVVFSEPINGASLTPSSFRLLRDGLEVDGEIRILDGGLRAEFTPREELLRSTEYTIALSTSVSDLSSDTLESPFTASFVTDNPPLMGKIVFEDRATGIGEIYFMNPDGTGVVQVTDRSAGGWSMSPALSPDGTTIAFAVWVPNVADWEIYAINVDGTGLRNITNNPAFDGWRPAWSPDGQRIAFFSLRDGDDEIYTISADGTDLRRLTFDAADDANPAWSPDGSKIAFVSNRSASDPLNYGIYVMNADGSNPVLLTEHTSNDDWPAWSPDGSKVAFVSDRSGSRGIWVMNADGSSPNLLVDNNASTPSWSPDGSRIAFDLGGDLYVMNADGTDVQRIRHGSFPSWGP